MKIINNVLFLLICFNVNAQTVLIIKGSNLGVFAVVVQDGIHVNIAGSLIIDGSDSPQAPPDAYLQNNGIIHISTGESGTPSNITNNVNGLKTFTQGQNTGEVVFEANNTQAINGTGSVEFMSLRMNNTASPQLELFQDVSVAGNLHLGGLINIKENNLSLLSSGTLAGAPYTSANMIQADDTGEFIRSINTNAGNYLFPVGDANSIYSPVSLDFASNATNGTIGLNLKAVTHPEMQNPETVEDYLSRYWSVSNTGLSTYSYNADFAYANVDINGVEQNIKISRWDNSWTGFDGSNATSGTLATTGLLNENTAPLTGDFTGRNIACSTPIAGFSFEQISGYTIEFTNTSVSGTNYQWDFAGNNFSSQENPEFTYLFEGFYPVILIVSNACGSDTITVTIEVKKFVSVDEVSVDEILIYPNPVSDFLYISYPENLKGSLNLIIYNAIGQIVHNEIMFHQTNYALERVNLTKFSNGIYIINISNNQQNISRKIIISK